MKDYSFDEREVLPPFFMRPQIFIGLKLALYSPKVEPEPKYSAKFYCF